MTTYVAYGESASRHVLDGQLVVASLPLLDEPFGTSQAARYLLSKIGNGFLDAYQVHSLGIADHGRDKAFLCSNSNTYVDVISIHNRVTTSRPLNGCIDRRDIPHGQYTGARESTHEPEFDAGLLEYIVFV